MPTWMWQDEDGEIIEPMLAEPAEVEGAPCLDDDLQDLIASRPSRRLRQVRPHA
jgi:hypothetical protein